MLKYCLVICLITSVAYGQSTIKGRVFENKTRIALTDIQVQDRNTNELTITDNNGRYTIKARVGDVLVFTAFSYQTDTVLVADAHEREVFLTPKQNMLNAVNVNTTAAPSTFKSYDPQFHGQPVIYQRDNNGNYKGGIIIRFWYWNKDEKKRERQEKVIEDDRMRDEIAGVFTAATVAKYIPLRGNELDDFVSLYTPDIKVYTAKDFTMLDYVNASYKKFVKLPPDKRHLEKLTK